MKTTGRASAFNRLEENPAKPFLNDLKSDIERINKYFNEKDALKIKKQMLLEITKSI